MEPSKYYPNLLHDKVLSEEKRDDIIATTTDIHIETNMQKKVDEDLLSKRLSLDDKENIIDVSTDDGSNKASYSSNND